LNYAAINRDPDCGLWRTAYVGSHEDANRAQRPAARDYLSSARTCGRRSQIDSFPKKALSDDVAHSTEFFGALFYSIVSYTSGWPVGVGPGRLTKSVAIEASQLASR